MNIVNPNPANGTNHPVSPSPAHEPFPFTTPPNILCESYSRLDWSWDCKSDIKNYLANTLTYR